MDSRSLSSITILGPALAVPPTLRALPYMKCSLAVHHSSYAVIKFPDCTEASVRPRHVLPCSNACTRIDNNGVAHRLMSYYVICMQ